MVTGAMARSRWIALAVLSAIFLAGAALGAAALAVLSDDRQEQPERPQPDGRWGGPPGGPSIFDQIGLTAEQKAGMDSIMERRRRQMDAFWEEHNPEVRAIIDSARAEVDRLLTPEQRQQYQEFRERRRRDHMGPDDRAPRRGPGDPASRRDAPADSSSGQADRPIPGRDSARQPISFFEPRYA
jgi:Spy/CpxP family protein refolding chaperone